MADFSEAEEAQPILRRLCTSNLRTKILLALNRKPTSLAGLRRAVKANAPNTSSKVKELERMNLAQRYDGGYVLTPIGYAVQHRLAGFNEMAEALQKHERWWSTHYLEAIPEEFLVELGALKNSEIVRDTPTFSRKAFKRVVDLIGEADTLRGAFRIHDKRCVAAAESVLKKGARVDVITTSDIMAHMLSEEFIETTKRLLAYPNFSVRTADVKFSCLVSNRGMVLGLFRSPDPDSFDWGEMLFSSDPKAINWAVRLFEYYKARSKPVRGGT